MMTMEMFVLIGNYALFIISAGMVATGAIIGNDKLIEYFLPLMTTAVGVWIGMRIPEGK